jgi:hypothetical protein
MHAVHHVYSPRMHALRRADATTSYLPFITTNCFLVEPLDSPRHSGTVMILNIIFLEQRHACLTTSCQSH